MKRLLSLVLSFAVVFSMMAPSVYAMETAEDYSGETAVAETVETTEEALEETVSVDVTETDEVSSEAENTVAATSADAYIAFRKNGGDETEYSGGYYEKFFMNDSVVAYITDGTGIVPVTDYEFYSGGDGVVATVNSDGCVELDLSAAAECSEHSMHLSTADNGYFLKFEVKKYYDVQNASLLITVNGKTYTNQESLANPVEITAGDAYTITARDGNGNIISDQDYFCGYGHGKNEIYDGDESDDSFSYDEFDWLEDVDPEQQGYYYRLADDQMSGVYTNFVQIGMNGAGDVKYNYSLKVTQPDGVWLTKYMYDAELYQGSPFELNADEETYFYVVSQGKRIPATEISVTQATENSATIGVYDETGEWYGWLATYKYSNTPAEGEEYHYSIAADGTNWGFSVALPENVIYADSENLTVYVEYDGVVATDSALREGTERFTVTAGESLKVWAQDLYGTYVTSRKQINEITMDNSPYMTASHSKAEDGSRLYTTITIPEDAENGQHWFCFMYDNDGTYRYFYNFPVNVTSTGGTGSEEAGTDISNMEISLQYGVYNGPEIGTEDSPLSLSQGDRFRFYANEIDGAYVTDGTFITNVSSNTMSVSYFIEDNEIGTPVYTTVTVADDAAVGVHEVFVTYRDKNGNTARYSFWLDIYQSVSTQDGVWYNVDGSDYVQFNGTAPVIEPGDVVNFYVKVNGSIVVPDNITFTESSLPCTVTQLGFATLDTRNAPAGEHYNIIVAAADTNWGFAVRVAEDGSTQPGEYTVKWGTDTNSLREDYALESVPVGIENTLYIELTDANGVKKSFDSFGITGLNGSDTSNIHYYINSDGFLEVNFMEGTETGEFCINFTDDAGGEYSFYFHIIEGNTSFSGTLEYRKEGEEQWKVASEGTNYTPWGALEVELFENIELKFTDNYGINVSDTVWFDTEYPGCIEWAWFEDHMVVRVNSSEELYQDIHVTAVVDGVPYSLNFTPVYTEPDTEGKPNFGGYAEGVIGDHFNPVYADLERYVHPAVKDCVLGIRFIDEYGDVIPMHRVKPVICTLPECLDVHWGFDIRENEETGEQDIYNEWELWFNEDSPSGEYTAQFVIDDAYLATVTFEAAEEGGSGYGGSYGEIIGWDYNFRKDGTLVISETDLSCIYVFTNDFPSDFNAKAYIGYVDEDTGMFVAYEDQYGVETFYNENGLPYCVQLNGQLMKDKYPADYANGFYHVAMVVTDAEGEFVCSDGFDGLWEGNFSGDSGKALVGWDYNFRKDGNILLSDYGITYIDVFTNDFPADYTAKAYVGYVDQETERFVPYETQDGVFTHYTFESNVPYSVEIDCEAVRAAYPEDYERGFLHIAMVVTDAEGEFVCSDGFDAWWPERSEEGGNGGNGDVDYGDFYTEWLYNDEGNFLLSTQNKTSMGVDVTYPTHGYYAGVEFGEVVDNEFVPYSNPSVGVEFYYNKLNMPIVAEFDGAAIAQAYPEAYKTGSIHATLVIYNEDGDVMDRVGTDFDFTDDKVNQFEYIYTEEEGMLEITDGPATINAQMLAEEFGDIADNIINIGIYGRINSWSSAIVNTEGSELLAAFPNVETINIFGLQYIDSGAFSNMSGLNYANMMDNYSMGDGVFENCSNLRGVELVNLEHVGINTFKYCPYLYTAGTKGYGDFHIIIRNEWDDEEKTLTLPANLFWGSNVRNAYICEYTHLGDDAFYGCYLGSLYLDGDTYVLGNALANTTIGVILFEDTAEDYFAYAEYEGELSYDRTIDYYRYVIASGYAGEYLGGWTWSDDITWTLYSDGQMIFEGTGTIGEPELYRYTNPVWDEELGEVVEKEFVVNGSQWAQAGKVDEIVIKKGITGISDSAFEGMEYARGVTLADSVTSIGANAFKDSWISSVVIPESVEFIGDDAFGGNTYIYSVWYAGSEEEFMNIVGNTSQPGLAEADIREYSTETFTLSAELADAGVRLRPSGSESEGASNITVPAGTQIEFVVPFGVSVYGILIGRTSVYNETFVAGAGQSEITANVDIGIGGGYADGGEINDTTWWLFEEDTLTIYGEGATANYEYSEDLPWYDYIEDIEYVIVDEGITAIWRSNLAALENAKTIYLPSTLTKIDRSHLGGLWNLEEYIVAEGNRHFKSIGGALLSEGGKKLIEVPACVATEDGVYTIPSTVETVGEYAFDDVETITKLIVPDNVTNLEWQSLRAGEEIVIGDGVTSLPIMPFNGETLKKLTLGKNVSDIHYAALQDVGNLEEIAVDEANRYFKAEDGLLLSKDGTSVYRATKAAIKYRNEGDETGYIAVPHGVKVLVMRSFMYMWCVDAVQLPESLTVIEKDVFSGCENLAVIYVPASVTSIGTSAFSLTGITNGVGHWDFEEDEDGFLNQIWVVDEPGKVYYGGTQTQWNKIKANIESSFDENQDVILDFALAGKLNAEGGFTEEERKAIIRYADDVTEEIRITVGASENPVTGETYETKQPMITWAMGDENYSENFSVEQSDYDDDVYIVTIKAAGEYEFMAYNGDNPSDHKVFKYKVTEKATEVNFNQLKGGHTLDGEYIIAAGKSVTPALKWTGGDNKAWTAGSFTAEYNVVCADEFKQYVTVDRKTGKVTLAADTPEKFGFALTYTATETDSTMGESYTVYAEYPMLAVKELVKDILVTNENEGSANLPVGDRVVMDQASGITEFTFKATASNGGWAYDKFAFTAPASANFTVVDNGDNTATVTLLGGTGSVVVTVKPLDGSNKTAKVTFTTGTTVKFLDIVTTMETTPFELGGGDYINVIALAKGKSTTLTADILPSTATNKAVKWEVLGDPAVATVSGTGKVDAKTPGMVVVRAVAQDGSGAVAVIGVQVVEAVTKVQMNALDGFTDGKVLLGGETATFKVEAVPMRNEFDANGKPIKDQFTNADVFPDVTWSITGALAKDVRYEVFPAEYDSNGNVVTPAYAEFATDKAGALTVKATANDGSGKNATFNVKVEQVPYAISMTAPKGAGQYVRNDDVQAWIIKGDTAKGITVKPTVVFNNGVKTAAVKAPFNTYKLYLDGEVVMNSTGTKYETSVKVYEAREYLLTVEDYSGNVMSEVVLDVREKSAIDLESLEIKLPNTIGEAYHSVQYAVKNKEFEISRYLNGTLAAKIDSKTVDAVWTVTDSLGNPADNVIVTKTNGKSYLKFDNSCSGDYSITLTLTDKADPENTVISNQINVVAVNQMNEKDMWFGIYEAGVAEGEENRIEKMGAEVLNPLAGSVTMTVNNKNMVGYCRNFEVKSSNAKALEIVKTDRDEFVVTPKAAGTVTLTIKALDGSNKTFRVSGIKVSSADSPVAKITASGTSFSVNPQQSIVVGYGLAAAAGKAEVSCADMDWVSSDERIATVEDLGVDGVTSVTDAKGNVTYTTNGRLAVHPTDKTGKVTITGTAKDGSGKTVKINITVEKNGATQQLSLNVPANSANGGETDGTVVLGWGKTLKLTATLKPNKAKNKAVTYKIEAVDAKDSDNVIMTAEELAALGVTVNKTGTVTAKAPNVKLPNPYSGWVKVTATLNYQLYDDMGSDIEAVQYIYIERPLSKLELKDAAGKNVTGVNVVKADINGTNKTIDLFADYTVKATYKGYSAKVDGVMTDLTTAVPLYSAADNLLWTTSDAKLATVDQYGVVTVNEYTKKGTVTITAMAQDGSNVKLTFRITVKDK
ncbi:MAG: hypothetical protein E7484_05890 [Ruminococcaceae bacterium]|nr:hypothetical protein [Oscillospiraceae bacterium]